MKAIYNNTTNSLIAFKGDHRPIQICKGGQLIDNISAVPLITEQDTYTSEYKSNLIGLELQGNDVVVNDYTKEVTMLLINGAWSQSNVTGVKLIGVPSELIDKEITYKLQTPLASGYSIGLLKGDNFLFGESVEISTTPIVASGYDTFYLNGVIDDADIPNILDGEIVEAYEYASPSNVTIQLSGANLYDISKVNGAAFASTSTPDKPSSTTYGTITNGVMHLKYGLYANVTIWTGAKIPIKKAGDYYFSCEVLAETSALSRSFYAQLVNKTKNVIKTRTFTAPSFGVWTKFPVGAITIPQDWVGDDVYLSLQPNGNATQFTNMPCYARNVMITFGEHTDYEPYFNPVEVLIPNELKQGDKLTLKDKKVMLNDTDITSTEVGQNLLALAEATQNQTNVITATSEIPLARKIITYAKWGGDSEN